MLHSVFECVSLYQFRDMLLPLKQLIIDKALSVIFQFREPSKEIIHIVKTKGLYTSPTLKQAKAFSKSDLFQTHLPNSNQASVRVILIVFLWIILSNGFFYSLELKILFYSLSK
jgi:hypothetical protein